MEFISIGKIINTHGIKGELKIYPLTDNLDRFEDLEYIYLGEEKLKSYVDNTRKHKDTIILKLNEYDNINQVLKFKNQNIYVDEDNLVSLPEDHYFIFQILSSSVYDQNGEFLGIVEDVLTGPANDVYIVKTSDNKEFMIPAVKEFVKNIDIENKRIDIFTIEGMIE